MKKSATETLISEIEVLTGQIFSPEQRLEIGERIRKYRFDQVAKALVNVKKLVLESGNPELSERIFSKPDAP